MQKAGGEYSMGMNICKNETSIFADTTSKRGDFHGSST